MNFSTRWLSQNKRGRGQIISRWLILILSLTGLTGSLVHFTQLAVHSQPEVSAGTIRGTVADESGKRLANVRITARNPAAQPSIFFASTDNSGSFNLTPLPPGKYELSFEINGYRRETLSVDLIASAPATTIEVKLNPVSLQGTIVDAGSGRPLRGVLVTAHSAEGKEVSRTTTEDEGQYSFGRIGSGIYTVTAALIGYETATAQINIPLQNTYSFALSKASSILINDHRPQSFTNVNPTSSSSASNSVQAILQDQRGLMWFATGRGVTTYDGSQSFAAFERVPELSTENVQALLEDRAGQLWFGGRSGVVRFNPQTNEVQRELAGYNVRDLAEDKEGRVWVATNRGLVQYDGTQFLTLGESNGLKGEDLSVVLCERNRPVVWVANNRGLVQYDGAQFQLVPGTEIFAASGAEPMIHALRQDDTGTIWIASARGLYEYANGRLSSFTKSEVLSSRPVTALLRDNEGRFWFATNAGVTLYDPAKNESLQFSEATTAQALYQDRDGNLWLGTPNGAARYDVYSFVTLNTTRGLSHNNVRAIWPERNSNRLWLATAGGVNIFDGTHLSLFDKLSEEDTRHLIQDNRGAFWFATARGIIRYDGLQQTVYDESQGLPSNETHFIFEDRGGQLWFATARGAARLDGESVAELPELNGVEVRHIAENTDGELLLATARGLYRYQNGTGRFIDERSGLASNNVYCVYLDREGKLWLGTDRGIKLLDNGSFTPFPHEEALSGESVRAIFQDRDGFFWFGASDGKLRKYLPFSNGALLETYGSEQAGIPAGIPRAIMQDPSGDIWFATEEGAIRHRPDRDAPTMKVRIFVNGRETTQTKLGSDRYNITFSFQGISPSGEVKYAYRLIGQDKDWRLLGPSDEHRVAYNDLGADLYTFEIRAFNHDLYSAASVEVPIEIAAPFYTRAWFLVLSSLAIIGLGAGAVAIKRQQERGPALPPHLQQFVPIEPNPYIVGNPIRSEKMFFGREDDFYYVRTKLEGAPQGVVIVFCGERRTGKSSILYQILNQRLGPRFVPVFIDMQEMVIEHDRGFFGRVATLCAQAIGGEAVTILERFPFLAPEHNPYKLFTEFIEQILRLLDKRTLLLLVDEYELLETKVAEGKMKEELFGYLAALMEKHENLAFLFTGSRRLEERDKRYWGQMLSRAIYRKISYLSENDTRRLITEPVQDRVLYHRNVVDAIVRLTSGQPFYTQVICQNLVDYLNEHEKNLLLSSDLKEVVDEILDHPLPQMIYFWESLNDDEKVSLSLLAESLNNSLSYASTKDLMRLIRKNNYPVNLSEDTVHLTLEELFRREVLLKSLEDSYRFRVGLFRVWIRRSHSIWQVIKEVKTL